MKESQVSDIQATMFLVGSFFNHSWKGWVLFVMAVICFVCAGIGKWYEK